LQTTAFSCPKTVESEADLMILPSNHLPPSTEGEVVDALFGKGTDDVIFRCMPLPKAMIVPKITLEEDLHNPLKTIGIVGG